MLFDAKIKVISDICNLAKKDMAAVPEHLRTHTIKYHLDTLIEMGVVDRYKIENSEKGYECSFWFTPFVSITPDCLMILEK